MRTILVTAFFVASATNPTAAYAINPADAITTARAHIDGRRYAQAASVLEAALEPASRLEAQGQPEALAAVHFYSAVAASALGRETKAREHLEKFFDLSPNARVTDGSRYDPRFLALFNDAMRLGASGRSTFETFYPGSERGASGLTSQSQEGTWGENPALTVLGSRSEKRSWQDLIDRGERQRFIDAFWKRRDPTPATEENEFRDTFERRVAFADRVFASPESRGSTSDRGTVFVLLGAPAVVRRRPLTSRDRVIVRNDLVDGSMETWVYTRDQLAIEVPKRMIQYRFVTQKGIGNFVLQREEVFAIQVLTSALERSVSKADR